MSRPPASPEGLIALGRRFVLGPGAVSRLARLQRLLTEDPLAPTAVRDPRHILDDHLADSLVALELEAVQRARRAVDIGSGAGVPGLPLAIALPEPRFTLLESASRKCAFISRAVEVCDVSNVEVVHSRAESWSEGRESFDLACCRAVAGLEVVVEYAAPLLSVGGALVAWRGARDLQAEERAQRAAELLGMEALEVRRVRPYPAARDRNLHLFSKVMETPTAFPRRPGVAVKHPLGGR